MNLRFFVACVLLSVSCATTTVANTERQYRAAMTKIFVPRSAFPMFSLNTARLGEVVDITNQLSVHYARVCYPNLKESGFRRIDDFQDRSEISVVAALGIEAQLLSKEVAAIDANARVEFGSSAYLALMPISTNDPIGGAYTILDFDYMNNECAEILRALSANGSGNIVVGRVFHGTALFTSQLSINASASASVKIGEIIRKRYMIPDGDVSVDGSYMTVGRVQTPGERTLAVVPLLMNPEELAAITAFLRGDRGAALDIAVRDALKADGASNWDQVVLPLLELLGAEQNCEGWVRRFFSGEPLETLDTIREQYGERIDMGLVATYGAANELACDF